MKVWLIGLIKGPPPPRSALIFVGRGTRKLADKPSPDATSWDYLMFIAYLLIWFIVHVVLINYWLCTDYLLICCVCICFDWLCIDLYWLFIYWLIIHWLFIDYLMIHILCIDLWFMYWLFIIRYSYADNVMLIWDPGILLLSFSLGCAWLPISR